MINAYVINLDARTDRWDEVCNQIFPSEIRVLRISAVTADELSFDSLRYAAPGVAATWLSHQKAAAALLKSSDDFALILEDDFVLGPTFKLPDLERLEELKIDFVQLGFLKVSSWESIDLWVANLRDRLIRVVQKLSEINSLGFSHFRSKTLIKEVKNLPSNYIPADIRPGGHCYLISRKMAEAIQLLNNPIIFSADELFLAISSMRALKMVRLRKSEVSQSNSPSSVTYRFKQY